MLLLVVTKRKNNTPFPTNTTTYLHTVQACAVHVYSCNTQYSELSTNLSKLELVQRSLLVQVVLLDLSQDLLPGGGTAGNTSHVVLVSSTTESYNR